MSIDPKFVELTADVLEKKYKKIQPDLNCFLEMILRQWHRKQTFVTGRFGFFGWLVFLWFLPAVSVLFGEHGYAGIDKKQKKSLHHVLTGNLLSSAAASSTVWHR